MQVVGKYPLSYPEKERNSDQSYVPKILKLKYKITDILVLPNGEAWRQELILWIAGIHTAKWYETLGSHKQNNTTI